MSNKFMALDIQKFAEGGAVGEGAAVGESQSGESKVVYGRQSEENVQSAQSSSPEEEKGAAREKDPGSEETFEELIKGKYKDAYTKSVQGVLGKRLAQERAKAKEANAIMQKLMVRYGVNDAQALSKALDSDEVIEAIAADRGESPETVRELERLRVFENEQRRANEIAEAQKNADEQYNRWIQEAEAIKAVYPDFNLENELENPQFRALITTKNPQYQISMREAYRLIHHEELVKAAEAVAAEKLSKSVNARAARPSENGLGNQSGIVVKNDVSKLTKKDRADIAKRVARGEVIEF